MTSPLNLHQFGIHTHDEWPHAFSPDHPDWNESYFFDWYDADGSFAGHCRIGWHPVQQRVLFWLFAFYKNQWFCIEEYRLPLASLSLEKDGAVFNYNQWGLSFKYTPATPLLSGELAVNGFARCLNGDHQGKILPLDLNLSFEAIGAPHSRGGGEVETHSAVGYPTNRYEQPIIGEYALTLLGDTHHVQIRGERDHSWGPRPWDMQWAFLALNNEAFSLQATVVNIPDWPTIQMGYFLPTGGEMKHITAIQFAVEQNPADPLNAVNGKVILKIENGDEITADVRTISGAEIDITHAFTPPKRTEYRRSLIECTFHDQHQGITSPGWFEVNRPNPE